MYRSYLNGELLTVSFVTVGMANARIAATALSHGMPLVTHDHAHFFSIESLQVLSEAPQGT